MRTLKQTGRLAATTLAVLAMSSLAFAGAGHDEESIADDGVEHGSEVTRLAMPMMNSERGMEVFVEKGCYTCHSVNGVGGEDALSLDAHDMDSVMSPFDIAARMWLMAPIMIPAQEEALGEQITFEGDELADIIAFLHDDNQQHEFVDDILTEEQMAAIEHGHGGQPSQEIHGEELGHGMQPNQDMQEEDNGHD